MSIRVIDGYAKVSSVPDAQGKAKRAAKAAAKQKFLKDVEIARGERSQFYYDYWFNVDGRTEHFHVFFNAKGEARACYRPS